MKKLSKLYVQHILAQAIKAKSICPESHVAMLHISTDEIIALLQELLEHRKKARHRAPKSTTSTKKRNKK